MLDSQCDLEEIEINTPNLVLLKYASQSHEDWFTIIISAKSRACLECIPNDNVDTIWFQKLRRFLDKKNGFEVLKLQISATSIDVKKLNMIPSYELEHVELELGTIEEVSVYVAVVNAVLWCCRPRSMTLISKFRSIDFEEWSHVIKSTYEKLLQQEDESQMNIQIVLSCSSKPKRHFSDLNSLLTTLPRDRLRQTITFVKEEGTLVFSFD